MFKLTYQHKNTINGGLSVKDAKGFTLIELMVTIAILVIVTTIAIPSFMSLLNNNRLAAQANEILAAVTLARAEAIKQNDSMVFCHSADSATCSVPPSTGWVGWVVHGTLDITPIATGIIQSDSLVVLSSNNVANAVLSTVGHSMRFTAQGLLRSGNANTPLNGVLRVCLPDANLQENARDVELRSGGRARVNAVSGPNCPAPVDPA